MDYTSQNYVATASGSHIDPQNKKANIEKLKRFTKMVNIAEELDKDKLYHIGKRAIREAEEDDKTREEWFDKYNEALKIAKQTIEEKTYPFDKAANVKIPLILQGCIQFNSRLMPEIIQNNKTVYVSCVGTPTSDDELRGERISDHMSLQTMKIIKNWITDTDKLMMALPLVGTVFRKWCYDPILRKPSSYLCLPTEVIVNNDITSLSNARRITHVLRMSKNEIIEKMRYGLYREIPLFLLKDEKVGNDNAREDEEKKLPSDTEDSADQYVVYEECGYLDLDEDGYEEPYIKTVLKNTGDVFRIVANYDEASFIFNAKDELIKIVPHEYWTAHHFLPSTDGTFLGMGFGSILLQLNSAINSIVNNLIDAGTLANIRGGFISRDLRLQKGELNFSPGEWKMVNSPAGQNIANSIYPLPISEPSQTLFMLLDYLVNFGRQIANISDVLMGNAANAQMPATSVVTLVEQGTKIFSSILMRLYESFKQEYEILYDINRRYISLYPQIDLMIKDGFITEDDYKTNKYNILPVANPGMGMNALKLSKLQLVMQMAQSDPTINSKEITQRLFTAMGISDPEKLFKSPQELQAMMQPNAEELKTRSEMELNQAKKDLTTMQQHAVLMNHEAEAVKTEIEEKRIQVDAAYRGGLLAIEKAKASAEIALKNAQIGQMGLQKINEAAQFVDKEVNKTDIVPDFSQVNQQLGLTAGEGQASMQQPVVGGGESPQGESPEAPQEQGGQLPPELEQQLQQVMQSQQQEQSK